ncbi:MAG: nitroreductase family deazaflavin-dependent oxidoreductase [Frankiaceae bacterium]|nr:nitroreductase family deazaflavin-dependent oxidoreductase [Frankiaceae bacterium]
MADTEAERRRRTVRLQRYVLNPPMKALTWIGLSPRHVLVETTGRVSGKRRRTIVGAHRSGDELWVVAEQGRHAGYVRNLEATPAVRVRLCGRWRDATATVLDDDDPVARLEKFGDEKHAALVQKFGTSLLTIRIDLAD